MSEEKKTATAEERDNRPIDDSELEGVSGGADPQNPGQFDTDVPNPGESSPTFRRYRR